MTSEYPGVDALLGVWDVLTAARLKTRDATGEVRALLSRVTLNDLFRPALWRQLNFCARIVPEGQVLPVRSVYDSFYEFPCLGSQRGPAAATTHKL